MIRDHDNDLAERAIEEILFHFPYLIDRRLKPSYVEDRQVVFEDGTRVDLKFEGPSDIFIIEIKKGPVDLKTYYQLTHYMNEVYLKVGERKKIIGVAIGHGISDYSEIQDSISKYPYEIQLRQLGKDIPTRLKFCTKCRRANGASVNECWNCGCGDFFH